MINDKTNDWNGWFYACGQFVAIYVGSLISDVFNDPRKPGEIVSILNILALLFCFNYNCGWNVFSENKEF